MLSHRLPSDLSPELLSKLLRRFWGERTWVLTLAFLLSAAMSWAGPRDVRRVLSESGFAPDETLRGPVMATPEPAMGFARVELWPLSREPVLRPVWIAQYDAFDRDSRVLTAGQVRELCSIFADRSTYALCFGGKMCLFHPDVAFRIPGDEGDISLLVCLGCDQVRVRDRGIYLAAADIDGGHNRLLILLRKIFPNEWRFRELSLHSPMNREPLLIKDQLDWARYVIPDDPLLKSLEGRKLSTITPDEMEELDSRCTAQMAKENEEEAARARLELKP